MAVNNVRKQSEQVGNSLSNNNLRKSMGAAPQRKYTNRSSQHDNNRVETNEDYDEGEVVEEESPAVTFLS
jgi:hypothetical protein